VNYDAVMAALQGAGTAQNRKVYPRRGADPANLFGVSFAELDRLKKTIKRDHALAEALWASGNWDARNLAVKLADPAQLSAADATRWMRDVNNYLHASELGALVARAPHAAGTIRRWTASKREFVRDAGYSALGALLKDDPEALTAAEVAAYVSQIETDIDASPNWARYGMNWALIAIGTYRSDLTDAAIAAAERIGTVEVDHGQTSCKTPAAAAYIRKAVAHQAARRAKAG
jgi:3-methyladenine DNA glycosylase AlkD